RDAQLVLPPGLQLTFLNTWRTVPWERVAIYAGSTIFSASRRSVQRACPARSIQRVLPDPPRRAGGQGRLQPLLDKQLADALDGARADLPRGADLRVRPTGAARAHIGLEQDARMG